MPTILILSLKYIILYKPYSGKKLCAWCSSNLVEICKMRHCRIRRIRYPDFILGYLGTQLTSSFCSVMSCTCVVKKKERRRRSSSLGGFIPHAPAAHSVTSTRLQQWKADAELPRLIIPRLYFYPGFSAMDDFSRHHFERPGVGGAIAISRISCTGSKNQVPN